MQHRAHIALSVQCQFVVRVAFEICTYLFELFKMDQDLRNLFDDEEEAIMFLRLIMRAPRRFRHRPDFVVELSDDEFVLRFRMSKELFFDILEMVQNDIVTETERNSAVTPECKLLIALRYFASGGMILPVADFCGASEAVAGRVIWEVCCSLARKLGRFIKMPQSVEERLDVMGRFRRIANFRRVIGAIDCTHIKILSPGGNNAELFRNRKEYFSWNVQVICDAELRIRNMVCRWPGSSHDSTIFTKSLIHDRFEGGEFPGVWLLGDSGYAVQPYLHTPLPRATTRAERLYQESHARTRNTVERCFGVWKMRFPILSRGINVSLEKSRSIVCATAVLHNIAINARDMEPTNEYVFEDLGEVSCPPPTYGGNGTTRRRIVDEHFALLK